MSKMESIPGSMGFVGLDTTTSPTMLINGALTKADEVVIRRPGQLEGRPGYDVLTMGSARPFNTSASDSGNDLHFPMMPVKAFIPSYNKPTGTPRSIRAFVISGDQESQRYWAIAEQIEGGIAAFDYPSIESPFMNSTSLSSVDPITLNPQQLALTDRNYWGQNAFVTTGLRPSELNQLIEGLTPRVVSDIYTTVKGPAKLEDWSNGDVTMGSRPLAIPRVPYVEARLVSRPWATDDLTQGIWATNYSITTLAYSAVAVNKALYGAPSIPCNIKTPLLPTPSAGTVTTDTLEVTITDFGYTYKSGDTIFIEDSSVPTWVGVTATITAATATTLTLQAAAFSGTTWVALGLKKWRMAFNVEVDLYQPKESRYTDGTNLKSAFPIKSTLTAQTHNYKLYRTRASALEITTVAGGGDPGAEFFEATNIEWGTTDATHGFISIVDNTKTSELGEFLYTNASQQGEIGANTPPPLATIAEQFNGYMFWAQAKERTELFVDFKTVAGSDLSLRDDKLDTTWAFTAGAAEDIALGVYLDNEPTNEYYLNHVGRKLEETAARSLVRIINSRADIPYNAYYFGLFQGFGTVIISPLCYRAEEYEVSSTDMTLFEFTRPIEDGKVVAPVESFGYRIYYSKFQIPHGTPSANWFDLDGKPNVIGLRSTSGRLNIITDNGLFELTGQSASSFYPRIRDVSAKCLMPGAIQTLNDNLIVMTTQGLRMYDTGSIISRPLDNLILPVHNSQSDVTAWAQEGDDDIVSSAIDEANNEYLLFLRNPESTFNSNHMLRFSMNTMTWTVSDRDYSMGWFHPDYKRMIFGFRDGTTVLERHNQSILVGSDEIYPVAAESITSISLNADGFWNIIGELVPGTTWGQETPDGLEISSHQIAEAGDYLYLEQYDTGEFVFARILPIQKVAELINDTPDDRVFVYTIDEQVPVPDADNLMWVIKTHKPEARFAPMKGENPDTRKKWSQLQVHISGTAVSGLVVTTSTEDQRIERDTTVLNSMFSYGFSTYGWGSKPWADPTNNAFPVLRTIVPQPHNSSTTLVVGVKPTGFNERFIVQGVSVVTDQKSTRTSR